MANPSELIKFDRPLRLHQSVNLDRFYDKEECGALWEMGTGKTMFAIAMLRAKYNLYKAVTPTLIVSPVATLYNWQNEFKMNSPVKVHENVLVPYMKSRRMRLTGLERAQAIKASDSKIIVINPDSLDADAVVGALKDFKPVNVIVDEADGFKSPSMFTASADRRTPSRLSRLIDIMDRAEFRMIMTGTPILNTYLDLWSQFRLLDKGATFGTNFFTYRETWFEDKNLRWKGSKNYFPNWQPKSGIHELISGLIDFRCTRVTKEECLDLPPLNFETRYVEMGTEQEKAYFAMEKTLVAEVKEGVCSASNALAQVGRLLQIISGHLPVEHDHEGLSDTVVCHFKENPRLAALADLLKELTPRHKVIVWCQYRASYPAIREVFKGLGIEFAELTGDTKNRQEEIDKFQNEPKCRGMLGNARAGGIGVNLTQASYAIYYSRDYSLRHRLQSLARNHRGGSEIHDQITAIDLVCRGTQDEDVLEALLRKENFADSVLDRLRKYC